MSDKQVGFSMKANAIRHVQKQHLDVPHKDIENYILVNELMQAEVDDDSDHLAAGYDTGSPSPSSTPGASGQETTPPMAHSTPVFSATSKNLPQASAHTEGPLDFSLRNPELAARLTGMMISMMPRAAGAGPAATGDDGEQPIDLTTKKKSPSSTSSSVSSLSPSPAALGSAVQVWERNVQVWGCGGGCRNVQVSVRYVSVWENNVQVFERNVPVFERNVQVWGRNVRYCWFGREVWRCWREMCRCRREVCRYGREMLQRKFGRASEKDGGGVGVGAV